MTSCPSCAGLICVLWDCLVGAWHVFTLFYRVYTDTTHHTRAQDGTQLRGLSVTLSATLLLIGRRQPELERNLNYVFYLIDRGGVAMGV